MSWVGLPPGNILQHLYLRERIKYLNRNSSVKRFLEIGSGNGYVSRVLLQLGLSGIGVDLNDTACENNNKLNRDYILKNQYQVINDDFISVNFEGKFDIIISCMVIEHLEYLDLEKFILKAKHLLSEKGVLILQVPANMRYWNIEDEIAGHIKRYETADIDEMCKNFNFELLHIAGLNYPLSNWLFHISNYIIKKRESNALQWSQRERTIYTGNRNVKYKTTFPKVFNLILNPVFLYPFHILQKVTRNKLKEALVIYVELKNKLKYD
ncbi:MAG: hypothetical protein Fur0023_01160 [Bacteroidia bacterium]